MVNSYIAAAAVPSFVTAESVPASPVITSPIAIVAAAPAGPSGPTSPVSPLST